MPLINLKTDLKSLRYGKDRIGGGDSGQPYIKSNIPDNVSSLGKSEDFLLRGGLNAVADSATDVLRLGKMFTDLKSPNGLLFTAKQNLLSRTAPRTQTSGFLNEGIYTPISTLAQAGVNAFGGHLNKQTEAAGKNVFTLTGAYSDNNTLYYNRVKLLADNGKNRLEGYLKDKVNTITNDQNVDSYPGGPGSDLGIGNTSIRFERGVRTGINNPLATTNPGYFYTGSVGNSLTERADLDEKRYFQTIEAPILVTTNKFDTFTVAKIGDTLLSPFTINNKLIDDVISNTGSYQNGLQNSTTNRIGLYNGSLDYAKLTRSGSSQTYINLTKDIYTGPEEVINNNFYQANSLNVYTQGNTFPEVGPLQRVNNTFTYTQEELINTTPSSKGGPIQDFRKVLRNSLGAEAAKAGESSGQLTMAPSYDIGDGKTIENRTFLGDPGNRKANSYASYTKGPIDRATGIARGPLDKINALPIYRSSAVDLTKDVNDFVKFRIAIIDNNDPTQKEFIHFRAILDSISDNYNAAWDPVQYLGRGEKLYNYNGFERSVSLGWTVAAQSKAELIPMYQKLNYLASTLAPDYSGKGYMRGNLAQLTIGGYLYEQPGIITSINYTMEEASPWEIGLSDTGGNDNEVKELTHMIKVSGFNFIPIHNFAPEKQELTFDDAGNISGFGKQRYIALNNGANNNYDN